MIRLSILATLAHVAIVSAQEGPTCLDQTFRLDSFAEGQGCGSGDEQSPINFVGPYEKLRRNQCVKLQEPSVTDPELQNKGTALQVGWTSFAGGTPAFPRVPVNGDGICDILKNGGRPTKTVEVQPVQFHFHSLSEHAVDGLYYAAETHIVGLIKEGDAPDGWPCDAAWSGEPITDEIISRCAMVIGTLWYTADEASPAWFSGAFDTLSTECGATQPWSSEAPFNLEQLFPTSLDHKEYCGSLAPPAAPPLQALLPRAPKLTPKRERVQTTPGDFEGNERCNEGVRWVVFDEAKALSAETLRDMQQWMGNVYEDYDADGDGTDETRVRNIYMSNRRPTQPLNGRTQYECSASASRP